MKGRFKTWRRGRKIMNLLFDEKDPAACGYTVEEENAAIDNYNEKADKRGWRGARIGHRA